MIQPHGGILVNRVLSFEERSLVREHQYFSKTLVLNKEQVNDIQNIASGVYSPLEGFLRKADFESVVNTMRLSNGTVWPIPIVLDLTNEEAQKIAGEQDVLLADELQKPVAVLRNAEMYSCDKRAFARNVFGTEEREHPGVAMVYTLGPYLVGGEIDLLYDARDLFPEHNFTPAETRELFQKRGWNSIVAFQTRNVPHRGHEFLQKKALEVADGLLVHPVIGEKKNADFKDEYIVAAYEILIDKYYPRERTLLGILPLRMRYAGPREAIFHAIMRKNFGCTHFIVGRDHAGVGNYYAPFAAQEIFDTFKDEEIGVKILKYPEVVWRPSLQVHTFLPDAPEEDRISFSGTRLRQYIQERESPPSWLIRPEVYYILTQTPNSLVDDMYKYQHDQTGFVVWLTGLSQAGKTTTAEKLEELLREKGLKVERLDGDVVREHLSRDLSFSKEDRNENIRRVGFVANLLSRNGIAVICSFISPYREQREQLRSQIENFIEVYCNCPVDVCEQRDTKGLYAKARSGEVKEFTGVSDPYEEPLHPEVELHTDQESVEAGVGKILELLEKKGLIM